MTKIEFWPGGFTFFGKCFFCEYLGFGICPIPTATDRIACIKCWAELGAYDLVKDRALRIAGMPNFKTQATKYSG